MNVGSRQSEHFDVVVLDDHLSYAQALVLALRADRPADRVACFATADEMLEVADLARIVLLDWQLGDADGLDVARAVAGRPNPPHIVMVSGHHSPALERMAASCGVCAVLPKHASIESILAAIGACRDEPAHERHLADRPETIDLLSRRQVEVLWLLSAGHDTGEVARRLHLSVATVRTYVRDACRRLDAHSQLEAVAKARRAGLIPSEVPPPPSRS
jgi:DNA-binding NarL/FixJ family response regulator